MKSSMKKLDQELANLLLFGAGKSVSIFGSSIYSFAIGLYVLKITGSALNFATTLMLGFLPMILISPIAGVIADRVRKKRLVVGMDILNGLLFLLIYMIATNGGLSLPIIYVSTVLLNVFTTFFGIGFEAAKPSLVSPQNRVKLNAVGKLIDSSAAILGPILGGVVYAVFDIKAFILFNGISFLISAFTEWFIDYEFYIEEIEARTIQVVGHGFKADLMEGLHYFIGSKKIMELFYLFVSLNFMLGFSVNVPAPYIINEVLKLPSSAYGLICTLFPVGLIIGTLTVTKVLKYFDFRLLLIYMNGMIAVLASMIGIPTLFPVGTPLFAYITFLGLLHLLMGIAIAYVDIPIMTLLQNEIPADLRGRVLSLVMSFVKIVLPIALLVSGKLIEYLPIVVIPTIGGGIALAYSVFLRANYHEPLERQSLIENIS